MSCVKHLLFIDDDIVLQKLIREYFSTRNINTYESLCCEDSVRFLRDHSIDIIILDILLPDQNGLDYLKQIKKAYPSLPVLMLSSKKSEEDRIKGFEQGADDYLVKPFNIRELELRVEKLLDLSQAEALSSDDKNGKLTFDSEQEFVVKNGRHTRLTTTEAQILKYFFMKPDQIVSRDDLSIELNGSDHNPLDRSIDVHINRIRKKIEDNPAEPKVLKTVWGRGYRFIKSECSCQVRSDNS